jgi:hypothetical protein
MISCWLSDSEEPVVTQFSMDAIRRNSNEYDYDRVTVEDGHVVFREGRELISYELKKTDQRTYEAHVYANGGGTLTTYTIITFRIVQKRIVRNGKTITLEVLDVRGIADGPQAEKKSATENEGL